MYFNPFKTNVTFLYPLKAENIWYIGVLVWKRLQLISQNVFLAQTASEAYGMEVGLF